MLVMISQAAGKVQELPSLVVKVAIRSGVRWQYTVRLAKLLSCAMCNV